MYDEYNALVKNGTWILQPRPPNANIVHSMWLYQHKYHADGSLSRYKACLVSKGSSEQLGVDCDETFSPVVKPATIHTLLSLALSHNWLVHKLDVENAFLNGDLIKIVRGAGVAYLLINVDDIILIYSSIALIWSIFTSLRKEFNMTFDVLNHFLRIFTPTNTKSTLGPKGVLVADPTLFCSLVGGTLDFSLQLYASSIDSLIPYSDVDWASCPSNRRSIFGRCGYIDENLLSWSFKRKNTISRSSTEVDYRGVANIVDETAWLRNLLRELHTPLLSATLVY
ncbi:ribonuclease H-like domain-containing protein [Tanacetum coccineum]